LISLNVKASRSRESTSSWLDEPTQQVCWNSTWFSTLHLYNDRNSTV